MRRMVSVLSCVAAGLMIGTAAHAGVDSGEFAFQGQLKVAGVPVNDTCDFEFSLWSDEVSTLAVDQVGLTLTFDGLAGNPAPIDVDNGLFTALLDFGATAFTDDPRWIEVSVSCPAGSGSFTTLSPRSLVTGVPHSIHTRGIAVDAEGDVGIGTDTASAKLTVEEVEEAGITLSANYLGKSGNAGLFGCSHEINQETALSTTHAGPGKAFLAYQSGTGTAGRFVVDNRASDATALQAVISQGTGQAAYFEGDVGIGTEDAEALLHVEGEGTVCGEHVAFFHNTGRSRTGDGIAIQINNLHTNRDNNFITFFNGAKLVTGRIEGFDLQNGDWISPPPLPNLKLSVNLGIDFNEDFLDLGALPTASLVGGRLPSLSLTGGSFPTANFSPGSFPNINFTRGSLPSLTITGGSLPTASFNRGSLPSLSFSGGQKPSASFTTVTILGFSVPTSFSFFSGSLPSATLNPGTRPSLSFSGGSFPNLNFQRGTLPKLDVTGGSLPSLTFTGGSFPTLNVDPGAFPTLSFAGGRLPSIQKSPFIFSTPSLTFNLPTPDELRDLFCWGLDNGIGTFMTMGAADIAATALKEAAIQVCKDEGVTYGSKGADYAEWLLKLDPKDTFQFGQIVGVHGGKVSLKTEGAEQIMAVSRAPVVVGNVPPSDEEANYVTVGFMGQLPVVVRGTVKLGDYIIPSGQEDGTATAISPDDLRLEHLGKTLGRAWSESDNDVYSLINVVIGLDGSEATVMLRRQHERMETQARRQVALAAENAQLQNEMMAVTAKLAGMLASLEKLEEQLHAQTLCHQTVASANVNH